MTDYLPGALVFFVGVAVGRWAPLWWHLCRMIRNHRRYGICFRYQPAGYRETRNGTNSVFCRRCGKAAGSHSWTWFWRRGR